MSITLLTVLVLLVGVTAYMLFKPLVRPVRVVGACVLMLSLAAFIVQNRETLPHQVFSDKRAPNDPTHDPGSVGYAMLQSISKEDHNFLDEILRKQNQDGQQQGEPAPTQVQNIGKTGIIGSGNEPVLKAELVINTTEVKRSERVTHEVTVKRAQLVTHNETFKRAELVRSRQQ
jgi:hypothetical protein